MHMLVELVRHEEAILCLNGGHRILPQKSNLFDIAVLQFQN